MRRLGCRNRLRPIPTEVRVRAGLRRMLPVASITVALIAIAPSWASTARAQLDPNRHGMRTVIAAGASTTSVGVRFTVRPVVLLVVAGDGSLAQIWTNLRTPPTAADLRSATVRSGSRSGPDVPASPALLAAAVHALGSARTHAGPGLVWST